MNAQYKKGVPDLCVLSLLYKRDCYGYEISDYLSNHIDIADGTVYLQPKRGNRSAVIIEMFFTRLPLCCNALVHNAGSVPVIINSALLLNRKKT